MVPELSFLWMALLKYGLEGFVLKYCIYLFSNVHIVNKLRSEKLIPGSCTYERALEGFYVEM